MLVVEAFKTGKTKRYGIIYHRTYRWRKELLYTSGDGILLCLFADFGVTTGVGDGMLISLPDNYNLISSR